MPDCSVCLSRMDAAEMEEKMAIQTVSGMGMSSYQQGGTVNQARAVETSQPPVKQADSVSVQSRQYSGNKNGALGDESIEKSNEKVKKAVSDLNKKMSNTYCQFGVHEGTGRVTIKIIDKETKDVVREYPAEETLEMIEKVWELAGILVDEKL